MIHYNEFAICLTMAVCPSNNRRDFTNIVVTMDQWLFAWIVEILWPSYVQLVRLIVTICKLEFLPCDDSQAGCRYTTMEGHCYVVAVDLGLMTIVSVLRWLTAVHRLPRQSASSPRVSLDSNKRWLVKSVGRERGEEGGSNSPEKLPVFPSGSLSPGNEISITKSNYCLLLLWDF